VALSFNADGTRLLTGGNDETLRVWEAPELRPVRGVSGDPGPVYGVAITGSGKWGASCALRLLPQDMVVQLWDFTTGAERRRLRGAKSNLTSVALTLDGRKVAAGTEDGTIHLWPLDPPNAPPLTLQGHSEAVTALTFVPSGLSLLSVGHDGTLRRWDATTGRMEGVLQVGAGPLRAVAFGGVSGRVALAGDRLCLRRSGGVLMTLEGHSEGALCVAFSIDGTLLASGGTDHTVRLWRASDGQEIACFEGHDGPVRAVAFSPDRRYLYSGGTDGTLRRWPITSA
jgi:WD40 repeat protein